ncbi:MAG: hypothetical protein HYR63_18330 [Proteobacteria bacterium]|nr:hypothetical protein [Pseudomonadota bacterium]MBI3499506.1 hypothetical protein [Pseudomonadota bacterium]
MARVKEQRRYIGFDAPVVVVTDPLETDIGDRRLRVLLRQWAKAVHSGVMPEMKVVAGPALAGLRDYLLVLEVIDGGHDFRYLFHGPAVAFALAMDMTDRKASELPGPLANLLIDLWGATVRDQVPIFASYAAFATDDADRWERLSVPVRQKSANEVDALLVGVIPIA